MSACLKKDLKKKLLNCAERSKLDALSEFNRRFGMPLYIPYVAVLCSFLLIGRDQSKRKHLYKYFYFGIGFLTLIMAEILVRYSGKSFCLLYDILSYSNYFCADIISYTV